MKNHVLSARWCASVALIAVGFCAVVARPISAFAQDVDAPTPPVTTPAAQPPLVGELAPDFELKTLTDETVKLSEQTNKGPVVLVELRGYPGYQCPFCTAQVGELLGKNDEFRKAKAQVVLIYPGPADELKARAGEFVRGKDIPDNFYLLLDPGYIVTRQYGLRWDAQNETSYPATFVLDNQRKVLFAKISRTHGDRAKVEDVLAALPKG